MRNIQISDGLVKRKTSEIYWRGICFDYQLWTPKNTKLFSIIAIVIDDFYLQILPLEGK